MIALALAVLCGFGLLGTWLERRTRATRYPPTPTDGPDYAAHMRRREGDTDP